MTTTTGWLATAGLVAVGALTPGPNNLFVMRTAARCGLRGAAPAIAGVVLGSVALVVVVGLGGGAVFDAAPAARTAVAIAGCLYLAWSGGALVAATFRGRAAPADRGEPALPAGAAALFGFQFLNPKGWVVAVTAASAVDAGGGAATVAALLPLFVVIPAISLVAWATLGAMLGGALRRPAVRIWSDRAMGGLLVASALLLLLEA